MTASETEGEESSGDETCPECGGNVERVLSGERRRRLSTFVSGALRHFPADAGLELDAQGLTDRAALEAAVGRKYDWADEDALAAVIATDPKGRFERRETASGTEVRAAYGHSVAVTLDDEGSDADDDGDVPDRLYHGTDPANLGAIRAEGLRPMDRQSVHLSGSRATAREVGRRHAPEPVVLEIDAAELVADGFGVSKRGTETYIVGRVPPEYLTVLS
ncbi:RNA 2'-phosphotransferase [Halorussus gelatinilyticus]|uniref:Probable RNA 2'-phosphotransferase n=1 Tax=Halorussus gelatinilyticus TaxID=2937524 RepID=A0A8U0INQ4_9EURY|nr:RNA 2'-phosphotransferase [Halorussus gelatinilyticus]UPW02388.1 RNA 2'-phosphotransferase [Halorussus gelatinilyticus]